MPPAPARDAITASEGDVLRRALQLFLSFFEGRQLASDAQKRDGEPSVRFGGLRRDLDELREATNGILKVALAGVVLAQETPGFAVARVQRDGFLPIGGGGIEIASLSVADAVGKVPLRLRVPFEGQGSEPESRDDGEENQ